MTLNQTSGRAVLAVAVGMLAFLGACAPPTTPSPTATPTPLPSPTVPAPAIPTPTATPESGVVGVTTPPAASRCEGLRGNLEVQVLVGPAEAVGLEPVAVGAIPFSVVSDEKGYLVQGDGALSYQETLQKEWGTYSVSLDMEGTIEGTCGGDQGREALDLTVTMSGEQMVEVRAEGFQGDYPWEGRHEMDLTFPLEDGASAEGEGWVMVLHLAQ